jgi:O-antigen ligase
MALLTAPSPRPSPRPGPRPSPRPNQRQLLELGAWLTPLAVLVLGQGLPERRMQQAIAVALGVLLVAALSRRPGAVACALVAGFPIAEIVLPLTLRIGMPAPLVRAAGSWKELLVVALIVAAIRSRRGEAVAFDRLDFLAAGYLLVVGVYYVFPDWLAGTDLIIPAAARDVAARSFALPVVALLAARHAVLDDRWRARVAKAAVVGGLLLGAGAIVEIVTPDLWERFLHDLLDVNAYQQRIFSNEAERTFIFSDPTQSGDQVRRAASLFGSQLHTAFALLLPLAVAMHLLRRRLGWGRVLSAGVIGVGLALTQTRSALLGAVLIVVGALRSTVGTSSSRVKLALGVALAAVVVLPLASDTALARRITGAITGADQESTPEHSERSRAALDAVIDAPMGRGLGSSGGTANRFGIRGHLLPENHYLLVALSTGVIGGVLFIGVVITAARTARRRASQSSNLLDGAAASALAATALAGLFLDSFAAVTSAVPLLVAVGIATSRLAAPSESSVSAPVAELSARA